MQQMMPDPTAQGEMVRALYDVAAAAASGERDPAAIAQLATDHATRLLGVAGGVVFIWDQPTERLQPIYETASPSPEAPLRPGEGMAGLAFQTGRPAVVDDYREWGDRMASSDARGMRGALAVPMMGDTGAIGVLGLWDYAPRRFLENEVQLLSLFAAHVAPVLEGAREGQARARQTQTFRALHELSVAAGGVLDPKALGRLVVDHASRLLNTDSATIRWWDPHRSALVLLASNDPSAGGFQTATNIGVSASGLVFRRGEAVIIDDYPAHPAAHPDVARWNLRSVVGVPLMVADRPVGTLEAASHTPRRFQADDAQMLALLAAQVAPALLAAQLAHERSEQATTFETLYEVAVAVSGSLEPDLLMDRVVEVARRLLRADQATLLVWDAEADLLRCVRDTAGLLNGTDVRSGAGAVGRAFERREPVLVEDYQDWPDAVEPALQIGYRSAIAVPLMSVDGPIGTVGVLSIQARAFTADESRVLALLAALVAPALESARLHADLARSEGRFRSLYGTMSGGVVIHGPDGRLIDANEQAARIFGDQPSRVVEPWIARRIRPKVFQEDGRRVPARQRPTQAAIATRRPVQNRVLRYQIPGRPGVWLRIDAVPVLDDAGEVKQVVTTFFDITELRTAQAQLMESQRRLAEVVSHAPVILFSVDAGGIFTLSEGSGLALLGLRPAEHVGRSIWELYPDNHPMLSNLQNGLAGKAGSFLLTIAGRLLETRYRPIQDAAGRVVGLTGVAVDVTEHHRAEEALRESEAKSRFLAAMSHELRTPLNSILGFAQLLAGEDFGSLNERQRRYVGYVESSGRHLLNLINDVLDLSKVEAGQLDIDCGDLEAADSLREAVDRVRPLANAKRLTLRVRAPAGIRVQADQLRLAQILLNLLSNAVKFTGEGGAIQVTASRRRDRVAFTVTDTGIGIHRDHQVRIFDDFVQVESGPSRLHEGTGLGLPLSRRLAALMGGSIAVRSELGAGSRFTLELPATPE